MSGARGFQRICSVPECDRTHQARGLCAAHYYRKRGPNGEIDTSPIGPPRVIRQPGSALREFVTYRGMHARVYRLRGPAFHQTCIYCPETATAWAYDHSDPDEILDPRGIYYSLDMDHYSPLCHRCHTYLDKRYRQLRRGWLA